MMFKDRHDAGIRLSEKLISYQNKAATIILGLPRGGVVVAYEVAQALHLPLDILVVRKMGAPYNPELAIGATDEEGHMVLNEDIIACSGIEKSYIEQEKQNQMQEAQHRLNRFRKSLPRLDLIEKTVILVDDGLATGATMRAAIHSAKQKRVSKVIVAVPAAARESLANLQQEVDEIIYLTAPDDFRAVGSFYEHFEQTTDEEVIEILRQGNERSSWSEVKQMGAPQRRSKPKGEP